MSSIMNSEVFEALNEINDEINKNGFSKMITLDPYFGNIDRHISEHTAKTLEKYPEDFTFFVEFMNEIEKELETYFETSELYEDEEFAAFEEDVNEMLEHYATLFKKRYKDKMISINKNIK